MDAQTTAPTEGQETPKTPDFEQAYGVIQHLETLIEMLKRTPDLKIQINDAFNFFYLCMPFFKNEVFYENVFEEFYPKDNPSHDIVKPMFDMMMIRYKEMFGFEKVNMLSPEDFQKLLYQGAVLKEEYEMFTGQKPMDTPPQMDPNMEAQLRERNINLNDLKIDPSKMETIHLDPSQMETIHIDPKDVGNVEDIMGDLSTGSTVVDEAIKDTLNQK